MAIGPYFSAQKVHIDKMGLSTTWLQQRSIEQAWFTDRVALHGVSHDQPGQQHSETADREATRAIPYFPPQKGCALSQQLNCKSTLERAFEMAGSGDVSSMDALSRALSQEGYSLSMLTGPLLMKQLRARIAASRPAV